MKRIKLLLAAFAAMLGLTVQAQTWTAPTAGEDPVSGNVYKVMNVEAGKFLAGASVWYGWSTSTALVNESSALSFTLSETNSGWTFARTTDGKLTFISGTYNGKGEMHVDMGNQGHQYFELIKQSNGYYHIRAVASDNTYGSTMAGYDNKCWGWEGASSQYPTAVYATVDPNEGYYCDWAFVTDASAKIYAARLALYNKLVEAEGLGVSTTEAGIVYTNDNATVDELNAAATDLTRGINKVRFATLFAGASNDNPIDVTAYCLTNADFSAGNIEGWETNYVSGVQAQNIGYQGASYSNGNVTISKFIEAWRPGAALGDGYLRQTVLGLPEGKYVLEADGISVWQSNENLDVTGAYLYIHAAGVDYKTTMNTLNNKPQHFSCQFLSPGDVDITFGLKTESATCNWLCADNFKVTFYGIDLSPYATMLAEAVAEAKAIEEESIPASAYAALQSIIAANNKTWTTSLEYTAAIAAVQAATETVKALQLAQAAKAANANVTGDELTALNAAIDDAANDLAGADPEALKAVINAFKAAAPSYDKYAAYKAETVTLFGTDFGVAAPTTAAEAEVAVQNLNIAQYNKVAADYPYSLTSKIGDFSTWTGTATLGAERTPDTPNSLDWEHWSGVTHSYYEQCSNGYGNAGGWTIQYEKKTILPAGSYVVKVAARSSLGVTSQVSCTALNTTISLPCAGNNTRGINTDGKASWNADDTFISTGGRNASVGGTGAGWQWRFLPFTLTEETEVTMTFYAEASTQNQWMSIADGELLSAENIATAVAYADNEANTIKDVDPANVTIARTVKEGFNTVVLPFDLTSNQVEAAFGTGTEVYAFSDEGTDPNFVTVNFNKVSAGTITANVPVLVKATAESSSQVFNGVEVKAPTADVKVAGTYVDFVGVYAPTTIAADNFFVGNGALYKSAGATNIKAFRAYIDAKETGSEVKMFIDGLETSISEIMGEKAENGAIYNLAGQRVQKAQKGIYVINGKKVLVK